MADHLRTELILDAVGMAIQHRRPAREKLVHHSDRGTQYTSFEFGRTLRSCGVLASMGSVADCYDNAMAESFFATLKTELVYTRAWPHPMTHFAMAGSAMRVVDAVAMKPQRA